MARIFSNEGEYYFDTGEQPPYVFKLDQDNLWANTHREMPFMDRVGIEDSRDSLNWTWWRCDMEPEQFNTMMGVVLEIGTIMMRSFPLEAVTEDFEKAHQLTEDDIVHIYQEGEYGN